MYNISKVRDLKKKFRETLGIPVINFIPPVTLNLYEFFYVLPNGMGRIDDEVLVKIKNQIVCINFDTFPFHFENPGCFINCRFCNLNLSSL